MVGLSLTVAGVFLPILGFQFVNLDVPGQVTKNPYIRGLSLENVTHILTSWCVTSYYPVRTLSYALDYQIWGLDPKGFKLTNLLVHGMNVLLLFWLILRLLRRPTLGAESPTGRWDVLAAAFSAGVFAVHPVVVEPVAWVSGREELLMVLGALGCFHFHSTARWLEKSGGDRKKIVACYLGAALSCILACLSNAVAAVIPLLVAAWDMVMLERPKLLRIARGTAVLWVIGAATIVAKRLGDASAPVAEEYGVFTYQRLLVILNVYWLNLRTLAWPNPLTIDYWNVEPTGLLDPGVVLGGLAIGLTGIALWKLRRWPMALCGGLWFGIALGPTAQIMPHHIDRADRFLYLPLVGLAVAASVFLRTLGRRPKRWLAPAAVLMGTLVLLALSARSIRHIRVWRDSITLWQHCLDVNPNNAFAHACLADALADAGRFPEAIEHYEISLDACPDDVATLSDYAFRLAACRQAEYRDYGRAILLAEQGCRISNWKDSRIRHTLSLAHMNLATSLNATGQTESAIEHYYSAIQADPKYEVPLFNLAMLYATCSDEAFRRPDEAVRLAEKACTLVDHINPIQLSILASVYAATGRSGEAVTTAEKAIKTAQDAKDPETVRQLQSWLDQHRASIQENR